MHKPPQLTRRSLLQAGALAALVGGSVVAFARMRGYAVSPGRKLVGFAPWQFLVVEHAARRIVDRDRDDASIPTADDLDVAGFVDAWAVRLPLGIRRDLGRFLAYVEHLAPMSVGSVVRFTHLPPWRQDRVLASIEKSSSDRLRAGFEGLRSLVFFGFYRDPRTWRLIGYDGPLVGRPAQGWL